MSQKSSPKSLPKIKKAELDRSTRLEEKADAKNQDKTRKAWIVILAFAILATFGVLVWLVFSGRSDQRINGDNINKLNDNTSEVEEAESAEEEN